MPNSVEELWFICVGGFVLLLIFRYLTLVSRPKLFYRQTSEMSLKLISACPTLTRIYWPYIFLWNNHLQHLPFVIKGFL